MKLPQYTATTTPRGSGLVRAQNINALTQSSDQALYSGLGAFGRGLNATAQLAFRASQERYAIDTRLQHAQATADYDGYVGNLVRSIDESVVQTPEQRELQYKELMGSIDKYYKQRLKQVDNPDAVEEIKISWQTDRLKYDNEIWGTLSKSLNTHQAKTGFDVGESLIKAGRTKEAEEHFNFLVERGLITDKQKNDFMALHVTRKEAFDILAKDGWEKAESYVMSRDIDTDIKRDIVSDIKFEAYNQDTQIEALREQDRDIISKSIFSGDYEKAKEAIETGHLEESEQWTWHERLRAYSDRLVKQEEVVTDQRIKRQLETMATEVLRTGKKTEFIKRLDEEFYDNKTIDESDYEELTGIAIRKFEAHQNDEIEERMKYATSQLLTVPSKESDAWKLISQQLSDEEIADKNELRKLESDNLDRYRRALRNMLEKHPDYTADEIYEEGRKLLSHYRKTPEQLRQEQITGAEEEQSEAVTIKDVSEKFNISEKKAKIILERQAERKKQKPDEKYAQQIEYLTLQFNLNEIEKKFVRDALNRGRTLDELVKHLQGKDGK